MVRGTQGAGESRHHPRFRYESSSHGIPPPSPAAADLLHAGGGDWPRQGLALRTLRRCGGQSGERAGRHDRETVDADGHIAIPGFYDDVRELSDAERRALNSAPFDVERYKKSIDIPAVQGEKGYTTAERTGVRPSLDVNGIWGGYMTRERRPSSLRRLRRKYP